MFIVDETIAYMRQQTPRSLLKIAGAANFSNAKEAETPDILPQAFVIATGMDATENQDNGTGLFQTITTDISIMVEFDNRSDRRGQTASQQAISMLQYLNSIILWGYVPPSIATIARHRGYRFAGAALIDTPDRARLWWEFKYRIDFAISDDDGVQPASVALQNIVYAEQPPAMTAGIGSFEIGAGPIGSSGNNSQPLISINTAI